MKTKLWLFIIAIGLVFASCEKDDEFKGPPPHANSKANRDIVNLNDDGNNSSELLSCDFSNFDGVTKTVRLIAGQHYHVGNVTVEIDETHMNVTYTTLPGWFLTETHLHIAAEFEGFPFAGKTNNPVPGHFKYSEDHHSATTYSYNYSIHMDDLPDLLSCCFFIAAHAVVSGVDGELLMASNLPKEALITEIKTANSGSSSYFPGVTLLNADFLNNTYDGWCLQREYLAGAGKVKVFSSLEAASAGYDQIDFNKINWILNNRIDYNYKDVQAAIWRLLGYEPPYTGFEGWNETNVEKILSDADGEFEPGCGQVIAIILIPTDNYLQDIIIEFPLPCGEETAWGEGERFTERGNWAMYFKVCGNNE